MIVVGIALLIPRNYRLGTSIALMVFWLSLHKYTRLGLIANVPKVTYFVLNSVTLMYTRLARLVSIGALSARSYAENNHFKIKQI